MNYLWGQIHGQITLFPVELMSQSVYCQVLCQSVGATWKWSLNYSRDENITDKVVLTH